MINRQSSFTALPNKKAKQLHSLTQQKGINTTKSAGGTIGNTLQNLAVLSCSSPVQFGMISKIIPTGSPASDFIQNNHHLMNLDYLSAIDGQVGCAYVLISEDGDRTFGINPGMTDQLPAEGVSEAIIKQANCLAISAFTLSNEGSPIFKATLKATELANKHRTPVVMSLASENLVQSAKCFLNAYLYDHVTVAAMNSAEARALTGSQYTLNACLKVLDQVDISLITDDKNGMYLCGYIDNPDISEQREHATGEDFSSLLNKYSDQ
ncbi:MAG: PfkB family carbohydrate kinase, partial [Endozoicomonas sp.]